MRINDTGSMLALRHAKHAFTLVELLVVIAIVGIVLALLLPGVQAARERARQANCLSNLRQIGSAIQQYVDSHSILPQGRPPAGALSSLVPGSEWFAGRSVHVALLPFLDESLLYDQFNFSTAVFHAGVHQTAEARRPGVYVCPSDTAPNPIDGSPGAHFPEPDPAGGRWTVSISQYGFLHGVFFASGNRHDEMRGCFNEIPAIRLADVSDGLSKTIFASERALGHINGEGALFIHGRWILSSGADTLLIAAHPPNLIFDLTPRDWRFGGPTFGLSSFHPSAVHILLGDGSARSISNTIDSWSLDPASLTPLCAQSDCGRRWGVLQALVGRNDAQPIEASF